MIDVSALSVEARCRCSKVQLDDRVYRASMRTAVKPGQHLIALLLCDG